MIAAEYIVRFLEELGVTHLFGIPGYASAPIYALLATSRVRTVLCKHEEGSAFMAYGYGLSQRGVAACAATSGAACVHLLTGVAAAYANSVPMLVLTSQVERKKQGLGAFQEMSGRGARSANVNAMFEACTIFNGEARTPEELPFLFAKAAAALRSPRKGPVHLSIPLDVMRAEIDPLDWRALTPASPRLPAPSSAMWERFLTLLANAEAPLFLLGRGCQTAQPQLREWMRRCTAPVATSIQGRALPLQSVPHSLGIVGVAGSPRANAWMRNHADLVVAIGTSLSEFTTAGFTSLSRPGVKLARFDIDPAAFLNTPQAELAVVADAADVFEKLLKLPLPTQLGLVAELNAIRNEHPPYLDPPRDREVEGKVSPMDLMDTLHEICPPDTHFVADSGNNALWAISRLPLHSNQGFHVDINTGCMGSGVVSAVGLKAALPRHPVVAICGDGGALMLGNEISTAADHGIDVIWVVLNDAKLGMVQQGQRQIYEMELSCRFQHLDLAGWAAALGARVVSVRSRLDLKNALKMALSGGGATVLDVHVNDHYVPLAYGRFQRQPEEEAVFQASLAARAREEETAQEVDLSLAQ